MSKAKDPMEMVDRYLQAVRFWMPKTQKEGGLIAELGDDLRSQIEDKETELGREPNPEEVAEILKRCGAPMVVASRLGPRRYLIGPTIFPVYEFVLKMVLLWILVPVFIFIVGPATLASTNGDWGKAILITIGNLWSGAFIAAGVITLVFVILERTHAVADITCKWDPSSLPPLEAAERKTSAFQAVCELGFGVFGIVWLLLVPQHPFLILGPAAAFLKGAPLWHTYYLPIVLLCAWNLSRSAITLAKPAWDWYPKLSELISTALTLVLIHFMLKAAGQIPPGGWQPFVEVAENLRNSAHFIKIAAIVNICIVLSLAGMWVGLCIAAPIQLWAFMSFLRKRDYRPRQTATLHVQ